MSKKKRIAAIRQRLVDLATGANNGCQVEEDPDFDLVCTLASQGTQRFLAGITRSFDWSPISYGDCWEKMTEVEQQRRVAYHLLWHLDEFSDFDTLAAWVAEHTVGQ